jgi:hypothetical protein
MKPELSRSVIEARKKSILQALGKGSMTLEALTNVIIKDTGFEGKLPDAKKSYMNEMNKIRHCLYLLIHDRRVKVEKIESERSGFKMKNVYSVK